MKKGTKKKLKGILGISIIAPVGIIGFLKLVEDKGLGTALAITLALWACGVAAMVFWSLFFEDKEDKNDNK